VSLHDAVADTGHAIVAFPPPLFRTVLFTVNPEFDWHVGVWTVPCDAQLPEWVLTIGGQDYAITDFTVDLSLDDGRCAFTIGKNHEWSQFTLGIPFFRSTCVTFDVGGDRIGFSRKIDASRH